MTDVKTTRADLIDMHKARVEACMEDYRQELLAYAVWVDGWRKREAERVARENKSRAA
jgi:hypothetical protein